jgi:hypothetical protein
MERSSPIGLTVQTVDAALADFAVTARNSLRSTGFTATAPGIAGVEQKVFVLVQLHA